MVLFLTTKERVCQIVVLFGLYNQILNIVAKEEIMGKEVLGAQLLNLVRFAATVDTPLSLLYLKTVDATHECNAT